MRILKPYLNFKFLGLVFFYGLLAFLCLAFAYELRFDFNVPDSYLENRNKVFFWFIFMQLAFLFALGQFEAVLSQFRLPDLFRLFIALTLSALYSIFLWYIYKGDGVAPRSVILTNLLLLFTAIAGFRIFLRIYFGEGFYNWLSGRRELSNVVIIGAGEVGSLVCSDILSKQNKLGIKPVIFLDDAEEKIGRLMHGIPIIDDTSALEKYITRYSLKKAIIAFPSASAKKIRSVAKLAKSYDLDVDIVPSLSDLVSGRATATQLRPVELEDLLGRKKVSLNKANISGLLSGERILVTGAGGSIGQEIVRQILDYEPDEVLCIDKSEMAIFDLSFSVLNQHENGAKSIVRILDITNEAALLNCFQSFKPTLVFHAAAHKHVHFMEDQPDEALRNNYFASVYMMRLAKQFLVKRFVFISTDKAINPTSVMGASKRLSELAMQRIQAEPDNQTRFVAVRFGNVLGSSGSVVNIFKEQIARGGPITVTDPEVTRFFMMVNEAVGLVLESVTKGVGGEIFVLDMGKAMKVLELARQLITLSGLKEGEDIDIEFTGLKPGEKLYEEVQHLNEVHMPTEHKQIFRFSANAQIEMSLDAIDRKLSEAEKSRDPEQIKAAILAIIPEYQPYREP